MENQVHPSGFSFDKTIYNSNVNCGVDSNRISLSEATFTMFWTNLELWTIGRNFIRMKITGDNATRNGYRNAFKAFEQSGENKCLNLLSILPCVFM